MRLKTQEIQYRSQKFIKTQNLKGKFTNARFKVNYNFGNTRFAF